MQLKLMQKMILIFVIILSFGCFGRKENNTIEKVRTENDWKKDNLNGKVKSYTEKFYELVQQNGSDKIGKRLGYFYKKFDVYGNLIEWGEYNDKNILIEKETYQYNENNDKILEEIIKDTFYDKITYKYDKNNNIIEKSKFRKNGTQYEQTLYKYNEKGYRILEEKYYDGNLSFITQISLDGKGNQIEHNNFIISPSGYQFANKYTYKYDNNGNKIEDNWYNNEWSQTPVSKYIYNYNNKGNETEFHYYNNGKLQVSKTSQYNYDNIGNLIESSHKDLQNDTNFSSIINYTKKYDNNGNEISSTSYSESTLLGIGYSKMNIKYTYDDKSNWIKKITYNWEKYDNNSEYSESQNYISEREIIYYE